MIKVTERQKTILLGLVFIIFVFTAYVTFFKNSSVTDKPPLTTSRNVSSPLKAVPSGSNSDTLNTALLKTPLVKGTDSLFQPRIRDIFLKPVSFREKTGMEAQADEKELSSAERETIQSTLLFKGSILHGSRSVAVINGSFFHIGDVINGFKLVFISEKEVWMDTQRGIIKLKIMNND